MISQKRSVATPAPSSTKRRTRGSSPIRPRQDATPESDVPRSRPVPSKRRASTIETEGDTEYRRPHKRARAEAKATAIEHDHISSSDSDLRFRRSLSPWPMIDEVQSQQEDLSVEDAAEARRQQRLYEEVDEAVRRWEKQRDRQCEAYRRFRLQRLPSPCSDVDDDDFPPDSDADEFGYTPHMLGLDHDDPRVEEVFGLSYTRKLERRKLRKPSRRPVVQASPDSPFRIQHRLSSAGNPNRDSTRGIINESSSQARRLSHEAPTTTTRPGRPSSSRITRQSRQLNTVFYELDHRTQARVTNS